MSRLKVLLTTFLSLSLQYCSAQIYRMDASTVHQQQQRALPMSGISPAGTSLSVNNQYFERNKKPWFPLMGEFHYWRYPQEYWEEQIQKMKSGGIQIVASYVYWGVHETARGVWRWDAELNLRRFVELCGKHGLYVWLRPGPYINADVKGKGFPDWVDEMQGKRRNSEPYLKLVDKYFYELSQQIKQLYFEEGGPIIGMQLENEYASGDKTHIGRLKEIAMRHGMKPVFWSVTGNSIFQYEKFEVIPLQGAYCYRGWESAGKLTTDFLFGDDQWIMGMDLGGTYYPLDQYPRGTCEQGSGMQETPKARFFVDPAVIEAHAVNQYGRGINMLGYFMFQGGTQYPGTELPAREGGYMPSELISYNYQAPLGEFGQVNESYKYLKMHHLFLNDFGDRMVTYQTVRPAKPVRNAENLDSLRYVGRFNEKGEGFVFINNTQNYREMTPKDVTIELALPKETLRFPSKPAHINDKQIAIWPVNFSFNGINIKYATAQILCKINSKGTDHLFMYETKGIDMELCLDAQAIASITVSNGHANRINGQYIVIPNQYPAQVSIVTKSGKSTSIILLSRGDAQNAWKHSSRNGERLVISEAALLFHDDKIECRQSGSGKFSFALFPKTKAFSGSDLSIVGSSKSDLFLRYTKTLKQAKPELKLEKKSDKEWVISNANEVSTDLSDLFLKVGFNGDIATAKIKETTVADQLQYGKDWIIGLKRFLPGMQQKQQQIIISASGKDPFTQQLNPTIKYVELLPEYKYVITAK